MNQHFETIWIEIKNLRSKNIVCGSVYRHPHNNRHTYKAFLDYMDYTISKLANENKELYICGDFNIDLHKLDQEENSNLFYELMGSYGCLPQIVQPTRITNTSATLIDNIYTNNQNCKIQSGNITTDFS